MDGQAIKIQLMQYCDAFAERRIAVATQAMNNAQQAANDEEKSSAGDKYETGRAMMQLERDNAALQIEEGIKLKQSLAQIDVTLHHAVAVLGSLVVTRSNAIFLAIGIGKVVVENKEYFIIAPQSPLGRSLSNKKVGDSFSFNGNEQVITKIF
jgi:transcription elongation GreA/GreB family factor